MTLLGLPLPTFRCAWRTPDHLRPQAAPSQPVFIVSMVRRILAKKIIGYGKRIVTIAVDERFSESASVARRIGNVLDQSPNVVVVATQT